MIFESHTVATPTKKGALNWGTGIFLVIAHVAAIAALWFWSWPAVITVAVPPSENVNTAGNVLSA